MRKKLTQRIIIPIAITILLTSGLLLEVKAQVSYSFDRVSIPYDSMPEYSVYREELVGKNWTPTSQSNFPVSESFPELICGNRVCSADWSHESGLREINILVWPSYDEASNTTLYRVAPAVD